MANEIETTHLKGFLGWIVIVGVSAICAASLIWFSTNPLDR